VKNKEMKLKRSSISAFRLTRHHFVDQKQVDLTTISQDVCGIQAQVMSAAEIQLWARMHNLTRTGIHAALWKSRTLVKTSCMRGTLHLLPVADFPIYISALKTSRVREMLRIMSRYGGVTQKEADGVTEAVIEALGAGPMTRRELTERIVSLEMTGEKAKAWFEQSWWGVVRQAMVEGFICYGPERGQEVTLIRVDQWLPKQKEVSEQGAQQILLRRYLSAYGPATLRDFSKWTGISTKEVKPVWESLKDELIEVSVADKKGMILREDYDQLTNSHLGDQILRLLPSFDPYMLGHAEKDHLVDSPDYKRVYRNAGWISPVVLLNGRVIGIWSYTRRGKRLLLEIEPFEKVSRMIHTKIEEEAASLGDFLETSWEVKFSKWR
jgi:uncharacterized protein YcaQ